ncbi:MAG: UDP-2,3-diacylglucosamine diphosphatase [Candidatus Cyclobacteriaceae bacterium M3_2C_046]
MKNQYKTIIVSDLHLGASGAKAKELTNFLKQCKCEHLILNGDIFEGISLKKLRSFKKKHIRFFARLLKMVEENQTCITFITGNQDYIPAQFLPFRLGNFSIQKDMVYGAFGKKYYVTHGDVFDVLIQKYPWLNWCGKTGLLLFNWLISKVKINRLKSSYSASKFIKSGIIGSQTYINNFESKLIELARIKKCDGIICGHSHLPSIKTINGIEYLNSGDWIESLSALVQDKKGEWSLIYYNETPKIKPVECNENRQNTLIKIKEYDESPKTDLKQNAG